MRSVVGYALGFVAGLVPTRERRIALLQTKRFLPAPSYWVVPRAFASAGSYLLESINLKPVLVHPETIVECRDWERFTAWLSGEHPVVALTAHTGNWDLLAAYCIARGAKVSTIGREARSPVFQEALRWMRDGYGIETIWRSDRAGLKRIISCFREKRVIAALIDQDTRVESVFVPFFGTPVKTPSSLVTLGKKFDARFLTAFIVRHSPNHFEILLEELPSNGSETEILSEYNKRLQDLIEHYPSQWVWFHKRWRSLPNGKTLSSTEYLSWLEHSTETNAA
jgi:KDO2-lipid IV(A) lauroyltransferase